LNTTTLLENPQVFSSALQFYMETDRNNCTVYAAIPSGITTTTNTPMSVGNIILTFNNTDCPAQYQGAYSTSDIPMTTSNQALFHKLKHVGGTSNWYYDVKVPAIGYAYKPGTYNYTLQFTMTQP
jgi:hypothetical protein